MNIDIDVVRTVQPRLPCLDRVRRLTPLSVALLTRLPPSFISPSSTLHLLQHSPLLSRGWIFFYHWQSYITATRIPAMLATVPPHSTHEGCRAALWTAYIYVTGDRIWDKFPSWCNAKYGSQRDSQEEIDATADVLEEQARHMCWRSRLEHERE